MLEPCIRLREFDCHTLSSRNAGDIEEKAAYRLLERAYAGIVLDHRGPVTGQIGNLALAIDKFDTLKPPIARARAYTQLDALDVCAGYPALMLRDREAVAMDFSVTDKRLKQRFRIRGR